MDCGEGYIPWIQGGEVKNRGLPRTGFVDHGQTWNFILKSVRSFGMFGEKED